MTDEIRATAELNAESEQLIGDIAAKSAIQSALLEEASAQP